MRNGRRGSEETRVHDPHQALQGDHIEITGIQREITGIQREITGIQMEITGIQREITGIQMEITGIQREITGIQREITATGITQQTQNICIVFIQRWPIGPALYKCYTNVLCFLGIH